ncbi:MAG: hypothetical protein R3B81_14115 [bacterium]
MPLQSSFRPGVRDVFSLAALALLLLWVPLRAGLGFEAKRDEKTYHLPLVQEFAHRAPEAKDLREAPIEMGPFYHIVLGGIGRVLGDDVARYRFVMLLGGLATIALFAGVARAGGADWRDSTLLLAAFPYFGVCYFTVMTDYAAFLFLVAAWLAQLRYLRTGGTGALWIASLAGLVSALVRQSMSFGPALVLVFLLGERLLAPGEQRRPLTAGTIVALAIPFLAIAVRLALWGGLVPPTMLREDGFLGLEAAYEIPGGYPSHLGLALVSMAATVGYYLLPATFALALAARLPLRRVALIVGAAAALTIACRLVRGPELVTTYGTYLHVVTTLRLRLGEPVSLAIVFLSLASFGVIVDAAWRRLGPGAGSREARFLALMTIGGFAALSFGKFRIFERYVVPLHALAIVFLSAAAAERPSRLVRLGLVAAVLFGFAHEVLYASDVYDLGLIAGLRP